MAPPLTFIDLFRDAGGLSLGFERAGFTPLLGVDADLPEPEALTFELGQPADPLGGHRCE